MSRLNPRDRGRRTTDARAPCDLVGGKRDQLPTHVRASLARDCLRFCKPTGHPQASTCVDSCGSSSVAGVPMTYRATAVNRQAHARRVRLSVLGRTSASRPLGRPRAKLCAVRWERCPRSVSLSSSFALSGRPAWGGRNARRGTTAPRRRDSPRGRRLPLHPRTRAVQDVFRLDLHEAVGASNIRPLVNAIRAWASWTPLVRQPPRLSRRADAGRRRRPRAVIDGGTRIAATVLLCAPPARLEPCPRAARARAGDVLLARAEDVLLAGPQGRARNLRDGLEPRFKANPTTPRGVHPRLRAMDAPLFARFS